MQQLLQQQHQAVQTSFSDSGVNVADKSEQVDQIENGEEIAAEEQDGEN